MTTTIEYALMAGASYISTRDDVNKFPTPDGWTTTKHENPDDGSGFEAVSFVKGNEIVISYAGTDPGDVLGDWGANLALAAGNLNAQLIQAAQ